jgi:hypothetical protein
MMSGVHGVHMGCTYSENENSTHEDIFKILGVVHMVKIKILQIKQNLPGVLGTPILALRSATPTIHTVTNREN